MDTENCCLGGQKCFNYYEQVDRQTSLFVTVVNSILTPGLRECEARQVSGSSHRVLQGKLTWILQISIVFIEKICHSDIFSSGPRDSLLPCGEKDTGCGNSPFIIYSILTNYNSESSEKKMLILPRKCQCKGVL